MGFTLVIAEGQDCTFFHKDCADLMLVVVTVIAGFLGDEEEFGVHVFNHLVKSERSWPMTWVCPRAVCILQEPSPNRLKLVKGLSRLRLRSFSMIFVRMRELRENESLCMGVVIEPPRGILARLVTFRKRGRRVSREGHVLFSEGGG